MLPEHLLLRHEHSEGVSRCSNVWGEVLTKKKIYNKNDRACKTLNKNLKILSKA